MLETKNLSKIYTAGKNASIGIHNINIKLTPNEFVLVVGESGSGKTTLLNVLSGIDSYEEGELLVEGNTTVNFSEHDFDDYRRRYVGFVFQNYSLIDSFTVYENVLLALKAKNYPARQASVKAKEMIAKVGLTHRLRSRASKLSGGEKQRCVIARALCSDAKIIACDEPTGNLDVTSSKEIIDLLASVAKNRLIIVVTHDPEQFIDKATRIIRIHDGEIVEDKQIAVVNAYSKTESIADRPKWYQGLYIAYKNILRTPKKTMLVVAILLLFIFTSLFAIETGISYDLRESAQVYKYDAFDFTLCPENSIMLFPKKKDFFSPAEVEMLSKHKQTYINPFCFVAVFAGVAPRSSSIYGFISEANSVMFTIRSTPVELSFGREPVAENEVAIGVKYREYFASSYYFDEFIKDEEIRINDVYLSKSGSSYTVTGLYFVEETEDREFYNEFYVSESGLNRLNNHLLQSETFFTLKTVFTPIHMYQYYEALPVEDMEILFNYDHDFRALNFSFLGRTVDLGNFTKKVEYGSLTYENPPPPDVYCMTFETIKRISDSHPSFILQQFDSASEMNFYLNSYMQKKMFHVMTPYEQALIPRELKVETIAIYTLIFISVVAVITAGYFVTYLSLVGIYTTRKKDMNIYRALGFTPRYLQYIATLELLIQELVCFTIAGVGLAILSKVMANNYDIREIISVFTNNPLRNIACGIILSLLIIRISFKANSKTLSLSIHDALKGGGHND